MFKAKSAVLGLALLVFCLGAAVGQTLELGTVNFQIFSKLSNQMENRNFRVQYVEETKDFRIYLARSGGPVFIKLSQADIVKTRASIEKQLEWEKTAIAKAVEIKKDLPDSILNCSVSWVEGKDSFSATGLKLVFGFLSRSKTIHWMQIQANIVEAQEKKGEKLTLEILYLDKVAIVTLQDIISEKNLSARLKVLEDQRAVENLFQ